MISRYAQVTVGLYQDCTFVVSNRFEVLANLDKQLIDTIGRINWITFENIWDTR